MDDSRQHFKISMPTALRQLVESNKEFIPLFTKGLLEIEIYKPNITDKQQPHTRDEIYIIIAGTAEFYNEGTIVNVTANDCLHVPACAEHRFFNFSDDFVTWIFFYGPEGGEQ